MSKVYFHADGTPTPHPTSRESAARQRKKRYDDGHNCPDCKDCTIKYTANGRCVHCARLTAMALYNEAILKSGDERTASMLPMALIEEGRKGWDADPDAADRGGHCASADQADQAGAPVWIRLDACERAGHPGVRTVDDRCWYCVQEHATRSARQRAIAAGEDWYTPDEACRRCGTYARRRVRDGRCDHCDPVHEQAPDGRTMTDDQTDWMPPDTVLSRQDARTLGLRFFRTGKPCRRRGHTGWRYTSTGACVDCKREG